VADQFGSDAAGASWKSTTEFTTRMMLEKYIHLEYFHIYRTLWRSQTCALDGQPNALQCPESCGPEVPESECVCTCKGIDPANGNRDFDWENLEPCLYSSDTSRTIFNAVVPEHLRKDIVTMFCSAGVKEGEMLESASPQDPLFWMIHPVIDRMLVAKRLAKHSTLGFGSFGKFQGFADESWLDYSYYAKDDNGCLGHGMEDAVLESLTLPPALIGVGDVNGDGALSNIEFYAATDPAVPHAGLTYVYDHFEWPHCELGDSLGEDAFATGYGGDEADGEPRFTFSGGVNPERWGERGGARYSELRHMDAAIAQEAQRKAAARYPGKQSGSTTAEGSAEAAAGAGGAGSASGGPLPLPGRAQSTSEYFAAARAGGRPGKRLPKSNLPGAHVEP
jgi:hypothetical protein